jgi:hypothetical protein
VLEALQINAVETMDEVLRIALERAPQPRPDAAPEIPVWQQPPAPGGAVDGAVAGPPQ